MIPRDTLRADAREGVGGARVGLGRISTRVLARVLWDGAAEGWGSMLGGAGPRAEEV
jgi:hypothetical protein